MKVVETGLPGVLILEPEVHRDTRGFFMESFHEKQFCRLTGLDVRFVQDNHSRSGRGVLRGLHYQLEHPQGKLVRVVRGAVFDVAVDIRRSSASFLQWTGVELSADNHRQLWVPTGFAHGFLVLSDEAEVLYKVTDYYSPEAERCLRWDDEEIGINWPLDGVPELSLKDKNAALTFAATFPE